MNFKRAFYASNIYLLQRMIQESWYVIDVVNKCNIYSDNLLYVNTDNGTEKAGQENVAIN